MWLTTEFMEMHPSLTQLLRAATAWPGSRWALAPEAGKADVVLTTQRGGDDEESWTWAQAREDQKGVLGRHRLGGLGGHRRRSLTAHRRGCVDLAMLIKSCERLSRLWRGFRANGSVA